MPASKEKLLLSVVVDLKDTKLKFFIQNVWLFLVTNKIKSSNCSIFISQLLVSIEKFNSNADSFNWDDFDRTDSELYKKIYQLFIIMDSGGDFIYRKYINTKTYSRHTHTCSKYDTNYLEIVFYQKFSRFR